MGKNVKYRDKKLNVVIPTHQVTIVLRCDWSWTSRDHGAALWLVPKHHVTVVLRCYWSRHITWPLCCAGIGPTTSRDRGVVLSSWPTPTHVHDVLMHKIRYDAIRSTMLAGPWRAPYGPRCFIFPGPLRAARVLQTARAPQRALSIPHALWATARAHPHLAPHTSHAALASNTKVYLKKVAVHTRYARNREGCTAENIL